MKTTDKHLAAIERRIAKLNREYAQARAAGWMTPARQVDFFARAKVLSDGYLAARAS